MVVSADAGAIAARPASAKAAASDRSLARRSMDRPPWFLTRLSRHIQSCFSTKKNPPDREHIATGMQLTQKCGNSFARRRRRGRRLVGDRLGQRCAVEKEEGRRVGVGEELADDAGLLVGTVRAAPVS